MKQQLLYDDHHSCAIKRLSGAGDRCPPDAGKFNAVSAGPD
jgi:hypothetical protein